MSRIRIREPLLPRTSPSGPSEAADLPSSGRPAPARAPATKIVFNATGQQYRQTTSFTYSGGTVTETPSLSDEIDRHNRAGWMSFKRQKRELYGRSKASLLPPKARMVRSEVVEALSYGCATWTPLKGHYTKLRTRHRRLML